MEVDEGFVKKVLKNAKAEGLALPVPPRADHSDHVVKLALMGHTKLAADHLISSREMSGRLLDTVGSIVRRLSVLLSEPLSTSRGLEESIVMMGRAYDLLLEIVWNLTGLEARRCGLGREEVEESIARITSLLNEWERLEREEHGRPLVLKAVVDEQLRSMKIVNKGNSMLAHMAGEVESSISWDHLASSYVESMRRQLTGNFYYKASRDGVCKFGNDYALGLRWLRHLGYVQVSTNPALAAKAYKDNPDLWDAFKNHVIHKLAKEHPEWVSKPDDYADEITMEATRFGLLDNFHVFRPVFHLSRYHDGLVSYQLNPLIAGDVDKSLEAALAFYTRLEEDLKVYDEYLLWGYREYVEKGRPNVVIKVAAAYPASIEIAEKLNELGIGQNITVSYTVSQEVLVGAAALRGMAKALRKGVIPTQTYDTNMGGRLEDHLRETIAARLLSNGLKGLDDESRDRILDKLARGLKLDEKTVNELKNLPLGERVERLTNHKVLGRSLLREEFVDALVETGAYGDEKEVRGLLLRLESDIALSGTYVAQRVYEIFFSPWNRGKWVDYLVREVGVTKEEAEFVLDRLDLLPASKRKPIDTLYAMSSRNLTNTEFPNHQLNVLREAQREGFKIDDYKESILQSLGEEPLKRLLEYEDFVKAYEASEETNHLLRRVGVKGDYGHRGVDKEDWPEYGPCRKTMDEFTSAYLAFRNEVVRLVKNVSL